MTEKKRRRRLKKDGVPETRALRYYDPAFAAKKRTERKALQRKFDRLAGPVTVRKVGDPTQDQEQEQEK